MSIIYYIEINAICISVLLLLCAQFRQRYGQKSTEKLIFMFMLYSAVFLCVFDMLSGILRGKVFYSSRLLISEVNLLYFVMITLIGYLWMLYVNVRLNRATRKRAIIWSIPLIVFILIAVCDPWTHLLFSLDEKNLYVREEGIYIHWSINLLYLLIPTIQIIVTLLHEKNKNKRRELLVLFYFIIAPSVASVIQMLFYGVSCIQVGITISLFSVFLSGQNVQILTDALTGLNNRRGFINYTNEYVHHHVNDDLLLLIIDINSFKQINDKLGHVVGDHALQTTARILKSVCAETATPLFLCRYGGDEFLIAGGGHIEEYEAQLIERIRKAFNKYNSTEKKSYTLTVSMGSAVGKCLDIEDVERLLRTADKEMYEEKKRLKQLRQ